MTQHSIDIKKWGPKLTGAPLKPTGSRIIVLPDADEEQTQGGIILKRPILKSIWEGTVLAVGSKPMMTSDGPLKPGDRIMYAKVAGERFEYNGEKITIITDESEIIGKIEQE